MTDDLTARRVTPVLRPLLAVVAVTVLLLGWFYLDSTDRADRLDRKADALAASLDASAEVIDGLAAGLQATREQLLAQGIEPDVAAPSETVREIIRETGATGATGAPGSQGIQGLQGTAGRDGRDGETPACWFEASQCQGEPGVDGEDGADGIDGQDGADSTVPGPQGPAGEPGADGVDGQDGAAGPACPAGYEPRVIETGPNAGWIACAPVG
jgi:hypothetical protein